MYQPQADIFNLADTTAGLSCSIEDVKGAPRACIQSDAIEGKMYVALIWQGATNTTPAAPVSCILLHQMLQQSRCTSLADSDLPKLFTDLISD